ncbi:unnamed protein product [Rodentolepis nana]|uniref:DUF3388 domain-containing protein n=1 Tax=Rodentolepis nana TaxID=102285 RepID=A0A0R3TUV4_RODNA|nr:unnamed protein product [Rodentolepis nana]
METQIIFKLQLINDFSLCVHRNLLAQLVEHETLHLVVVGSGLMLVATGGRISVFSRKRRLAAETTLNHLDASSETCIVLKLDAFQVATGVALQQMIKGETQLLSFYSKNFPATEVRHSSQALLAGIGRTPITIFTDHAFRATD